VNGRKVIGLAQVRRRHGALLQTGIYTHWHPRRLADLLIMPPEERAALTARLEARVAGLANVLPEPEQVAHSSLFPLLVRTFADVLYEQHGITLTDAEWSSTELHARTATAARFALLQRA
jgi:lipoate-protein ligase A